MLEVEQDSLQQYNLYAYCLNNPVNRLDDNGKLSLPVLSNWQKIAIGSAAIAVGVAVTLLTGGGAAVAASALVSSVKVAAIGAAFGAGGGVIDHLVSTGSLKGGGKAAINGAVDGFMWGGITAGASTVALASKGVYINKIGRLKPSNSQEKVTWV